jgi:hypothetical protein
LRDRPVVEADAVPGHGPLLNGGVLHHAGVYHLSVRAVRDGCEPAPSRLPGEIRDSGAAT